VTGKETVSGLVGSLDVLCNVPLSGNGVPCPKITALEFVAQAAQLDANPPPAPGGGLRIFPDNDSPSDASDRTKVTVRAITDTPNAKVYFRAFDVDDPSTDDSPVDSNGLAGNDNRGTPKEGTLSSTSATTDASGVAQVDFTVTTYPGNNFKIAASCKPNYLSAVVLDADGRTLKHPTDGPLPTTKANATQMLTVWRHLHIKADTMTPVHDNFATGALILGSDRKPAAHPTKPNSTLTTDLEIDTPSVQFFREPFGSLTPGQFEGGRICLKFDPNSDVCVYGRVEDNLTDKITILVPATDAFLNLFKNRSTPVHFELYDDDDYNNNQGEFLTGDQGETIQIPGGAFSLLSPALAQAYIVPDVSTGGLVAFRPNVPEDTARGIFSVASGGRGANYWATYVLFGYQIDEDHDGDPEKEWKTPGTYLALSYEPDGFNKNTSPPSVANDLRNGVPVGDIGTIVALETFSEQTRLPHGGSIPIEFIVLHELGHQLGLRGDNTPGDWGIMSNPPTGAFFVGAHLNIIRSRVSSPGQAGL
jgi:hypothetical protein